MASSVFLSPQERAYLYHVVKKNQVLNRSLGSYFDYSGEVILLMPTEEVDYDSVEQIIINDPQTLYINFEGIKSAPQSILVESCAKLGLWKLIQMLDNKSEQAHQTDYKAFMNSYKRKLPDCAYKDKSRKYMLPQALKLVDPGLSLLDKREIMHELGELTLKEHKEILVALDETYKEFTFKLTSHYYDLLGGSIPEFNHVLLAAGEGSKTYGIMEEFDKKENGKLDKGAPKGIGLFTYQYEIKKNRAGVPDIFVKSDPVVEYEGYEDPKNTKVHLSLWGFNSFFQTTVVLKTGSKSYILYANRDSKELSADSTYTYGRTYQDHVDEMENKVIPKLEEELYGKTGHQKSYEQWKTRKENYKTEIHKAEVDMRTFEMEKNKKKLKKARDRFIDYTQRYENARSRMKQVYRTIYKKEQQLEYLKDELYYMKSNLGASPVSYQLLDSIYVFDDGAKFNPFTQDFEFASIPQGRFSVRLISIGSKPLAQLVDEVQLMINVIKKPKRRQISFSFVLNDNFKSDEFEIDSLPLSNDQLRHIDSLISFLAEEQKIGVSYLFGGGVGVVSPSGEIMSDTAQLEIDDYPGITKKERLKRKASAEFKKLRSTSCDINLDEAVVFTITSFTDPVRSNLNKKANSDSLFIAMTDSLEMTNNQLLSCLRSMATFDHLLTKFQERLAQRNDLSIKDLSAVSNILNRTKNNSSVQYKGEKITWTEYIQFKSLLQGTKGEN